MYAVNLFIYQQITKIVLVEVGDGSYFPYKYNMPYSTPMTINKGTDNVLLFEFQNQAQKPVNITGSSFIFRVMNNTGAVLLIEKPLVILNAATGRAKVTMTAADLMEITPQTGTYSVTVTSGNLTQSVFTNANSGAQAPIIITSGSLPTFVPSTPLIMPTTNMSQLVAYNGTPPNDWPDWAGPYGQSGANYTVYNNTEYYSSEFYPRGPITTVQYELTGYTGTVKAQAAQDYQSVWYDVTDSVNHYNQTGTKHLNIIGWHPLLRLCFNNSLASSWDQPVLPATAQAVATAGVITQVILTNPGSGYLAAPLVTIEGSGAGCILEAVMDGTTLAGINIINGGSGYRPMLPTNQPGIISITTGFVSDVFYR